MFYCLPFVPLLYPLLLLALLHVRLLRVFFNKYSNSQVFYRVIDGVQNLRAIGCCDRVKRKRRHYVFRLSPRLCVRACVLAVDFWGVGRCIIWKPMTSQSGTKG